MRSSLFNAAGRLSEFAVSHLPDNTIMLNHHRDHGTMARSLAIVKTRASSHDPGVHPFTIGRGGISLAVPGGHGVVDGPDLN